MLKILKGIFNEMPFGLPVKEGGFRKYYPCIVENIDMFLPYRDLSIEIILFLQEKDVGALCSYH